MGFNNPNTGRRRRTFWNSKFRIDYRSLTRIPNYIVIVASASKYGDYFTGSTGSTMWLDDLELIYE